jgi:hypothetical protein|tara:strand:+ start:278 stop:493 length:216 start_codon:yes stop_codon:yes gene_type:complete
MRLQLTADDIMDLIEAQMAEIKIDRHLEYPQIEYTASVYSKASKKSKIEQQHAEADHSFLMSFSIEEYSND